MAMRSKLAVRECPIVPWFRFKGGCNINTCKGYSEEGSRCIYIETGMSRTSDIPVQVISRLKSETIEAFAGKKKKAVMSVKNILTLYMYIVYIHDTFQEDTGTHYTKDLPEELVSLLTVYPLNISVVGFKPWMALHIFNEALFESYLSRKEDKRPKVKLHTLLKIPSKEFSAIRYKLNNNSLFART